MAIGANIFAGTGLSADSTAAAPALATETYGPPASGSTGPLSPRTGHGLGFWLSVGGVVALWCIRQSLPR